MESSRSALPALTVRMSPLLPTVLLAGAGTIAAGPYILRAFSRVRPLRRFGGAALLWRVLVLVFLLVWFIPYYSDKGMDSVRYHFEAIAINEAVGDGKWSDVTWQFGSAAMYLITALLYFPFGATLYGGFIVGALVGLVATILFVKAASILGYSHRAVCSYTAILVLLPSFAMWTSIAGKDSWTALGLGLFSYGYAQALRNRGGISFLVGGLALTTILRPHIGIILPVSMVAATLLAKPTLKTKFSRRIPLLIFGMIGLGSAAWAARRLLFGQWGLDQVDAQGMFAFAQTVSQGNRLGGSVVDNAGIDGIGSLITTFPEAIVRILFRPFPWEANNFNALLGALENVFIGFLMIRRIKSLRRIAGSIISDKYLLFCVLVVLLMIMVLAPIPNLGLLSRLRAQLMPFLFAALVMPSFNRLPRHPASVGNELARRFYISTRTRTVTCGQSLFVSDVRSPISETTSRRSVSQYRTR